MPPLPRTGGMPAVRPMRQADLPACAAIEATAPDAWGQAQLAEELAYAGAGGAARLYVAELDGPVAGLAAFQLAAGEASLNTLAVAPAVRRRGVGEALLRAALASLRAQGAQFCFLEVRAGNRPALALYQKLGFARVGVRKGFYHCPPEDGVVLRCAL